MKETIANMIDFMRGKVIITCINLLYHKTTPFYDSDFSTNQSDLITIEGNCLKVSFKQNFINYVEWPFISKLAQIQNKVGNADVIEIIAHQLFENNSKLFSINFSYNEVTFTKRENIEDTLFLDLERYCKQTKIKYRVS